jgi:large subunit ribosomal protein L29
MRATQIRSMTDVEIEQAIENAHQEILNLRFQMATGQLSNTSRVAIVRRDIARLCTVQRERTRVSAQVGEVR